MKIFFSELSLRAFPGVLFFLITACSGREDANLFKDFEYKEDVVIVLSAYHLDSIPKDIGFLVNAKSLAVSIDSPDGDWTIYPPLSALDDLINQPPLKKLPNEITNLKGLKRLTLPGLSINELPKDFDKLGNLEYLDLSFNKLLISSELPKLKKLKNLKQIGLIGNKIDTAEIKIWKQERPDIQIQYGME